ncbi:MAG: hypothetical protein U0T69_09240 [Chitinophagales bacterium]
MTDLINPIAELNNPDSGKFITPGDAHNMRAIDKKVKFYCPDVSCLDKERILFLRKSLIGNYHFSHRKGFGHDISPQTLLHKLAIKWFEDKEVFELPNHNKLNNRVVKIDKNKTILEYNSLNEIIPDVKIEIIDSSEIENVIAIEIVVTNDILEDKLRKIQDYKLQTITIDLQEFYWNNKDKCRVDVDFVKENLDKLLTSLENKRWITEPNFVKNELEDNPALPEKNKDNRKDTSIVKYILGFSFLYFLYKIFYKKKDRF